MTHTFTMGDFYPRCDICKQEWWADTHPISPRPDGWDGSKSANLDAILRHAYEDSEGTEDDPGTN